MIKGIDVSTHQGIIDWKKVKESGTEFVIIRSSFGWNNSGVDKRFYQNAKGCRENGIPFGAYHYSYATTVEDARLEADFFLQIIRDTGITLPLYLDFEEKSQRALPIDEQMAIIEAFLEKIREAGYTPGLYMSKNSLEVLKKSYEDRLKKYSVWVAQWNSHNTYSGDCDIWQYSSSGKVDGISTVVDLDYGFFDLAKEQSAEDKLREELTDALKRIDLLEDKLDQIRKIAE